MTSRVSWRPTGPSKGSLNVDWPKGKVLRHKLESSTSPPDPLGIKKKEENISACSMPQKTYQGIQHILRKIRYMIFIQERHATEEFSFRRKRVRLGHIGANRGKRKEGFMPAWM